MSPAPIRLPSPRQRMSAGRKELVVLALRRGQVTRSWVLAHYALTEEELAAWERGFAVAGREGLKTTKLQEIGR